MILEGCIVKPEKVVTRLDIHIDENWTFSIHTETNLGELQITERSEKIAFLS